MNKGRKVSKTPVKPANSPWWGGENHPASGPAPSSSTGSALDLSSLPKLGQQTLGQKPKTQGPPGVQATPVQIQMGPGSAVPPTPTTSALSPAPGLTQVTPGMAPGIMPGMTPGMAQRDSIDQSNGRAPVHLSYLDATATATATPGMAPGMGTMAPGMAPGAPGMAPVTPAAPKPAPIRQPVDEEDKFGLKPLLNVLTADSAGTFSPAVGTEIAPFPETGEQLSKSFASPWTDSSKHFIIPEYSVPSCYNVQSVVPQQQKLQNLTEETLFYIFYTMPRDAMQEAVAVELTNRNWRYHKELRVWLTKDPLSEPVQQNAQAESGVYVFFEPAIWEKVKREYVLYYPDIA